MGPRIGWNIQPEASGSFTHGTGSVGSDRHFPVSQVALPQDGNRKALGRPARWAGSSGNSQPGFGEQATSGMSSFNPCVAGVKTIFHRNPEFDGCPPSANRETGSVTYAPIEPQEEQSARRDLA
jgi:hypothetical protein